MRSQRESRTRVSAEACITSVKRVESLLAATSYKHFTMHMLHLGFLSFENKHHVLPKNLTSLYWLSLCRFRWMKNGQEFDPFLDPRLMKEENSGTFVIPNNGNLTEYQGTYRCYASNKVGTAISREIEFIVPSE